MNPVKPWFRKVQAKDRELDYEERRRKPQGGRRGKGKRIQYRSYKESLLWLEHVAVMKRAGIDVEKNREIERRRR